MKRGQAEALIDRIRVALARGESPELTIKAIERALSDHGLDPFEKCDGQAHRNPFIDNCWACAPRWGVIGEREKVT